MLAFLIGFYIGLIATLVYTYLCNEAFNPGPSRGGYPDVPKLVPYNQNFTWLPSSMKQYPIGPHRSDHHLLYSHPLAFNSNVPVHSKTSCNVALL